MVSKLWRVLKSPHGARPRVGGGRSHPVRGTARQAGQGWNDPGRHYPLNRLEALMDESYFRVTFGYCVYTAAQGLVLVAGLLGVV